LSAAIAAAFAAACRDELEALKPGNVHVFADGHRMTADQFVRSAEAAASPLTAPGATVGARILGAVAATTAAVGTNTNLGIILLCAPLAAAAEQEGCALRLALLRALGALTVEDATLAFRAIALASPGGLGTVEQHDVRAPATVSLLAAMAAAADRDRIARQYASGFGDVFGTGAAALSAARARSGDAAFATMSVYLAFLAAFRDSHIVRKHGPGIAEEVRRTASGFVARIGASGPHAQLHDDLMAWDRVLKDAVINPGTSADLTVATLFADRLAVGS
jgi:triphosphoribosyl-dephospho-CoA synthase